MTAREPGPVVVTPFEIGLHSFAEAVNALDRFQRTEASIYDLTDAVLRSYHALETLFKIPLILLNPALVLGPEFKVKALVGRYAAAESAGYALPLDDELTIELGEAFERIVEVHLIPGPSVQEVETFGGAIAQLKKQRNAVQHYRASFNPTEAVALIGEILPRGLDLLDIAYREVGDAMLRSRRSEGLVPDNALAGFDVIPRVSVTAALANLDADAAAKIPPMRIHFVAAVKEALARLEGKKFSGLPLNLKLSQHGQPYLSRPGHAALRASGFLKFSTGVFGELEGTPPWAVGRPTSGDSYQGEFEVRPPEWTVPPKPGRAVTYGRPDEWVELAGTIDYVGSIVFNRVRGRLPVGDNEADLEYLRDVQIEVKASFAYRVRERNADLLIRHFQVRGSEVTGLVTLRVHALPLGYSDGGETDGLIGIYTASVPPGVAKLDFMAGLEEVGTKLQFRPEGLQSIELQLDIQGDLEFGARAPTKPKTSVRPESGTP